MKRDHLMRCAAGPAFALAALFLLACGNTEEETPTSGPYEPSQPKFVLANVELVPGRRF